MQLQPHSSFSISLIRPIARKFMWLLRGMSSKMPVTRRLYCSPRRIAVIVRPMMSMLPNRFIASLRLSTRLSMPRKRRARIAAQERQAEDAEEALLGERHVDEARLAVAQEDRVEAFDAGDLLDLREIVGEAFGDDSVRALLGDRLGIVLATC